jgi:excisionase family DNA binding protein
MSTRPRDSATQLAFTSSQAAIYLGVSLPTVRRWSNAGFLRGSRTPRTSCLVRTGLTPAHRMSLVLQALRAGSRQERPQEPRARL